MKISVLNQDNKLYEKAVGYISPRCIQKICLLFSVRFSVQSNAPQCRQDSSGKVCNSAGAYILACWSQQPGSGLRLTIRMLLWTGQPGKGGGCWILNTESPNLITICAQFNFSWQYSFVYLKFLCAQKKGLLYFSFSFRDGLRHQNGWIFGTFPRVGGDNLAPQCKRGKFGT